MVGIYVHIPFCKQACYYCNFHFSTQLNNREAMVEAICKDIDLRHNYLSDRKLDTLYFGGGTPSLLSSSELTAMLNALKNKFNVSRDAEITLEANPDDINPAILESWLQLGVNRLSLGIQSFNEAELKWMNRAHNALEAETSIKRSQDAGFENLSIDLIYGYPLLTDSKWLTNINKAIEFEIPHISAYSLTVEPKTALAVAIKRGKDIPCPTAVS